MEAVPGFDSRLKPRVLMSSPVLALFHTLWPKLRVFGMKWLVIDVLYIAFKERSSRALANTVPTVEAYRALAPVRACAARFQQTGVVGALADFGNRQVDFTHPRLPHSLAIAVALRDTFVTALITLGTDRQAHFLFHQQVAHYPNCLPQEIWLQAHSHLAEII